MLRSSERISFAIDSSIHLKVVVSKIPSTIGTREAIGVEFLLAFTLEVLAFNSFIASLADTAV